MSASHKPIYPVVLLRMSQPLSTAEQMMRAILIFAPTAACRKCEQIDNHVRKNDGLSLENAACRPSIR
jgi:hypothetical protein